jgi:hypothetical protein
MRPVSLLLSCADTSQKTTKTLVRPQNVPTHNVSTHNVPPQNVPTRRGSLLAALALSFCTALCSALCSALCLALCSLPAVAQQADTLASVPALAPGTAPATSVSLEKSSIEGIVINAGTQEPIAGVKVEVVGKKLGAITNAAGKFSIKIAPGVYAVKLSAFSFEPFIQSDVFVGSGKPYFLNVELRPQAIKLRAAEVEASYFRKNAETITSTQLLSAEDIRRAPGVQEDVVRAVALLPGVAVAAAGRNDLAVRGGAPFENLFLVDNIEVPNINHFGSQGSTGGPLSIINIDFVKDVSFSTGGFGARYGDRVSSATNLTLREGNDQRFSGKANLSATGFGIYGEGPIADNGSFLVGVRRSYLDLIFKAVGFGFIPEYWDFTAKVNYRIDSKNSLSFLGIGALGTVSFNNNTEALRTANSRITAPVQNQYFSGLTWKTLFGNGFMNVTLGRTFTRYTTDQNLFSRVPADPANPNNRDSTDRKTEILRVFTTEGETSLRADVVLQALPTLEVSFGNIAKYGSMLDYDLFVAAFARRDQNGVPRELRVDTTFSAFRNATYAQAQWSVSEQFRVTAGIRADYYSFIPNENFVVAPRLALSYSFSPTQTLNLSGGRYYQAPQYIWLLGEQSNRNALKPIRVDQAILGYEWVVTSDLKFQIEGYYKDYANYPGRVFRPQAVLAPSGFDDVTADIPFGLEPLESSARGTAYGVELFLQKKLSEIPLYGLISASYNVTRFQGLDGTWRVGSFDSPLIFNVAAGYRFSDEWELSMKVRSSTGLPTTPFITTAERAREMRQPIGAIDFGRYNDGERLRRFYALDVRLDKRWYLAGLQLVTYVDVQNITGRRNESGVRWDPATQQATRVLSIGVLPSIGVTIEF